jgi:primosomal protein N'
MKDELLTKEYRELLAWEHANTPGQWGQTAKMYVPMIVENSGHRTEWLDYGAGHGGLGKEVRARYGETYSITEYEPSRDDETGNPPAPAPYVVCVDVLEHIEPELLENVLDDLHRVTIDRGYFTISCRPATKILKDGRNAHLIVKEPEWWLEQLTKRFNIVEKSFERRNKNLRMIVENQHKEKWTEV